MIITQPAHILLRDVTGIATQGLRPDLFTGAVRGQKFQPDPIDFDLLDPNCPPTLLLRRGLLRTDERQIINDFANTAPPIQILDDGRIRHFQGKFGFKTDGNRI